MINRRQLLSLPGTALLASSPRKKVAAVITEYRRNSHADVRMPKVLEGYHYNGAWHDPRLRVVSMYVDQFPDKDLSREVARKHNVSIFPSVGEALRSGGKTLAVDGVMFIGEHGNYPENEKGQKLYPRYRLYKQIVETFRDSGRSVPVFHDKHFSVDWKEAKWMFDQSRELKFTLLAGSSYPLTWRVPALEFALQTPVETAVIVGSGPKESYGFHLLEGLQCMVERRAGGETGIAAVQCIEGEAVWRWTDDHVWAAQLLDTALAQAEDKRPGSARENAKQPIAFVLEYTSGLRAAVFILNGHLTDRAFAARVQGQRKPAVTRFVYQNGRPWGHSTGQVYFFEEMVLTGRAAYPAERTLLVTGALAALMDSSFRKGARLETPHLRVAYRAPEQSVFNQGPMPPLAKPEGS
ncbi:MAG: hypothetical protein ACKV22_15685 [Bryobacteraceae bacterium]